MGEGPFSIPQYIFVVNLYIKFEVSILNGCGDIFHKNLERKKKEYREEQIGEDPFSNPLYN